MTPDRTQLGPKDIIDICNTAKLREYGARGGLLADYWRETAGCSALAIGLDNFDSDHVLLQLLRDEPLTVIEGSQMAAKAVGAAAIMLYLPEGETSLKDMLAPLAAENDIDLVEGIVDARSTETTAFHHIETVYALAKLAQGQWDPGLYVSIVTGGSAEPLQKVAYGTPISSLIKQPAKRVRVGIQLLDGADINTPLSEDTQVACGVIEVFTDKDCIVQRTEQWVADMRGLTCGKCVFCREGYGQIQAVVGDIKKGKGDKSSLSLMTDIADAMRQNTLCSIGQLGASYCFNAVKQLYSEFEAHLRKVCPADTCFSSEVIYIDPQQCTGCGDCMDACPEDAVEGRPGYIHMIDERSCTLCGACVGVCADQAIVRAAGKVPKLPTRPTKCGKFRG